MNTVDSEIDVPWGEMGPGRGASAEHGATRPPANRLEMREWLIKYAGVSLPTDTCGSGTCTASPLDALWYAYSAQGPRSTWHGSRGMSGKSVNLACLVYVEAITLGASSTLLGGSFEQSQGVHRYLVGDRTELHGGRAFWNHPNSPRSLLVDEPTKRLTKLTNGGSISVLTASQKSVRGPHPHRLRGDEIDEMDASIWDAAQGQAQASGGILEQTVGSSTWQNAAGTMSKELRDAREKDWPVHRWCFKCMLQSNGGWLTEDQVRRKRSTVSSYMWRVEYTLEEPAVTGTLFDRPALEKMFRRDLGEVEGGLNTVHTFEEPERDDQGRVVGEYAIGGDWGQKRDRDRGGDRRLPGGDVGGRAHGGQDPLGSVRAVRGGRGAGTDRESLHRVPGGRAQVLYGRRRVRSRAPSGHGRGHGHGVAGRVQPAAADMTLARVLAAAALGLAGCLLLLAPCCAWWWRPRRSVCGVFRVSDLREGVAPIRRVVLPYAS